MMENKHLYEYAVIRVLPKVEREEFINVGVILFSKRAKYIAVKYEINEIRIKAFCQDFDISYLREVLASFDKICKAAPEGGIIATYDIPERFRWLTAMRSACVQTSRPHPGFSSDLDITLNSLFEELVL